MSKPVSQLQITKVSTRHVATTEDILVVEEPLEIKLAYGPTNGRQHNSLAITMRTPGQDEELVLGFLLTEGLIGRRDQVLNMRHVGQALHPDAKENVLLVELHPEVPIDFEALSRHFYTSSSCGVCGKASIEMVRTSTCYFPRTAHPIINAEVLHELPTQLRQEQSLFDCTGGIHAAALFDADGKLILMREDVGRHNAMDKLIGAAMQQDIFPLRDHIILVSGRASFELVQKALMAGVPFLAAVGAPSSLAVELADDYGMSLVGFLRGGRFNVYCGVERIKI